jgi:hypothetical protein
VIDYGRLVAQGSPDQLKAMTHQERAVRILLTEFSSKVENALQVILQETGARLEQEPQEEGVSITVYHPADLSGRVAATVALNGGSMLKLEVMEPTLEDAMLVLAGKAQNKELAHVAP